MIRVQSEPARSEQTPRQTRSWGPGCPVCKCDVVYALYLQRVGSSGKTGHKQVRQPSEVVIGSKESKGKGRGCCATHCGLQRMRMAGPSQWLRHQVFCAWSCGGIGKYVLMCSQAQLSTCVLDALVSAMTHCDDETCCSFWEGRDNGILTAVGLYNTCTPNRWRE